MRTKEEIEILKSLNLPDIDDRKLRDLVVNSLEEERKMSSATMIFCIGAVLGLLGGFLIGIIPLLRGL